MDKVPFMPPKGIFFREQWQGMQDMVGKLPISPPVETLGADALSASRNVDRLGSEFRFQSLIATMLSPQTKDEQTAAAFQALRGLVGEKPFLPSALAQCSENSISDAIKQVSFFSVKAKNIKTAAQTCSESYNDDIPSDIDDLLAFKGVGPKIGYLTFTIAWGKTLGICVDTHVHRISNRLGWVDTWSAKSNGPERTRLRLQEWLPRELWSDINHRLVGFGQSICFARNPACHKCELTDSCKYYQNGRRDL
jgi:endonuclease-3